MCVICEMAQFMLLQYVNTRQLQSSYNNFNSFKALTQQGNGKTVGLLANVIIRWKAEHGNDRMREWEAPLSETMPHE